jgi:hypothetical protein
VLFPPLTAYRSPLTNFVGLRTLLQIATLR